MAPKATTTESEVSEKAAATRAEIGNRPRQSVKRFVEYFNIVNTLAPERVEELFGDQTPIVGAHADEVDNPVIVAREKADAAQLELAVKALQNEDPLNGYAGFVFNEDALAEKLRERKPRVVKTVKEKVQDVLASASPEDLADLAALLKEQGVEL
jgi:DNA-directed RNA polymerase subunit F